MAKVIRYGDTTKVQPPTFLAVVSSLCPVCGRYIAKNRSLIAKLPEPIKPNVVIYDDMNFNWNETATFEISGRSFRWSEIWRLRSYVHADCYDIGVDLIEDGYARLLSPRVVKRKGAKR